MLLVEVGTLVVRQTAARAALLHGDWGRATINAELRGGTGAVLVISGGCALTLAWMLLGMAVWRSQVLSRVDGVLVILAAPLIFLRRLRPRPAPGAGQPAAAGRRHRPLLDRRPPAPGPRPLTRPARLLPTRAR